MQADVSAVLALIARCEEQQQQIALIPDRDTGKGESTRKQEKTSMQLTRLRQLKARVEDKHLSIISGILETDGDAVAET